MKVTNLRITSYGTNSVKLVYVDANEKEIDRIERAVFYTTEYNDEISLNAKDIQLELECLFDELTINDQIPQTSAAAILLLQGVIDTGFKSGGWSPEQTTTVLVDVQYSADGTAVTATYATYNLATKETGTIVRIIPVVDGVNAGMMTAEAYSTLLSMLEDVEALKNQGGRFMGVSFATKADLDAYAVPANVKEGDFTYVLDDETQSDATTRYIATDGGSGSLVFDFAYVINYDPIGIATLDQSGLIQGSNTDGKVFVEADGTGSVVGWDALGLRVSELEDANLISSATVGSSAVPKVGQQLNFPAYPTTLPASDVPTWAKAATKPAYTAAEVGALPLSGGTMTGGIECPNGNAGLRHALLDAAITPNIYSAITQCTWAVSGAKGGYSGFAVYNSNHAESWNFMGQDGVSGGIYKPSISKWLVRGNVSGGGSTSLEFGSVTVPNGGVSARDGFFQTSDARKKEVEKPLDCSLEDIAKLQPIYYRWKDAEQMGDARHIGLIAQEVQRLFPELVIEDEQGMLSLNYAELSAVAMRGIKLLKDKTDDLEVRLAQIEAKLLR